MPTTIIAAAGDTLCGIAIRMGFANCDPIRNFAGNAGAAFLSRALQAGDSIIVPDLTPVAEDGATEVEHLFQAAPVGGLSIRFVRGSPDRPFLDDDTLTFLNVSNFIANKAGNTGTATFPTAFGFNAGAHADPDIFKVEIVDPGGPNNVFPSLEALKPVFSVAGAITGHEPFPDPDHGDRSLPLECRKVSSGVCYRSQYLKLVVDDADFQNNGLQFLQVSDTADGQNTDADKVEILDQIVRVSYRRDGCRAPDDQRCTVRAELPIGPRKMKLRVAVRCFRTAPGAGPIIGASEAQATQLIRRRILKHFRRIYAQAELAPKITSITFHDPPASDMLVIGPNGRRAAGGSTISFTISQPPPVGASAADPNVVVAIPPTPGGLSPAQVGALVVAAVAAQPGFQAELFTCPRAATHAHGACDVIVTRTDGARVAIINESTNDTGLTAAGLVVARVNINAVNVASNAATHIPHHHEYRRCVRVSPGTGDTLTAFVIGAFTSPTLLGQSILWGRDLAGPTALPDGTVIEGFRGDPPMQFVFLIRGNPSNGVQIMGDTNTFFNVFSHEAMHTLADVNHLEESAARNRTELMFGTASQNNSSPAAPKRIADTPLFLKCSFWDPTRPNNPSIVKANLGNSTKGPLTLVERLRDRCAPLLEAF